MKVIAGIRLAPENDIASGRRGYPEVAAVPAQAQAGADITVKGGVSRVFREFAAFAAKTDADPPFAVDAVLQLYGSAERFLVVGVRHLVERGETPAQGCVTAAHSRFDQFGFQPFLVIGIGQIDCDFFAVAKGVAMLPVSVDAQTGCRVIVRFGPQRAEGWGFADPYLNGQRGGSIFACLEGGGILRGSDFHRAEQTQFPQLFAEALHAELIPRIFSGGPGQQAVQVLGADLVIADNENISQRCRRAGVYVHLHVERAFFPIQQVAGCRDGRKGIAAPMEFFRQALHGGKDGVGHSRAVFTKLGNGRRKIRRRQRLADRAAPQGGDAAVDRRTAGITDIIRNNRLRDIRDARFADGIARPRHKTQGHFGRPGFRLHVQRYGAVVIALGMKQLQSRSGIAASPTLQPQQSVRRFVFQAQQLADIFHLSFKAAVRFATVGRLKAYARRIGNRFGRPCRVFFRRCRVSLLAGLRRLFGQQPAAL